MSLLNSQQCKAVLAVNYFGFAQDLAPFREYCSRTGATLIEDNAHGFLSKDTSGVLLGTRADLGITSIRKTFRLVNGAALYFSGAEYSDSVSEQLEFQNGAASKGVLAPQSECTNPALNEDPHTLTFSIHHSHDATARHRITTSKIHTGKRNRASNTSGSASQSVS